MRVIPLLLLLLLATPVSAQSPDDFAWQWPIVSADDGGAQALVLEQAVYARLTRPDLGDLAAFNADGQPVPFAPLPWRQLPQETRTQLNWLRLPVAAATEGDSLSLRLQRDADGSLRDLQLDSHGGTAAGNSSTDLLIDLGETPPPVAALRLTLADDVVRPVDLRVRVLASDDLADWRPLGDGLALMAIDDNGLRIERLRLDFAPSSERYLRLALPAGGDWPALARIEHERRESGSDAPPLRTVELQGRAVDGEPGVFEYASPGPLPVSRVDVLPAAGNTVAGVVLQSRDEAVGDGDAIAGTTPAAWATVATFTAFRIGGGDSEVRHLPVDTGLVRDRRWRLRTTPALAQAPVLQLSYHPDRFVLLAQGPAPYRLLAGSARARRPDWPVQAALAAAGQSQPAGWVPPLATLGEGAAAAGDAALRRDRGPDYRRWALWAVLAIGAGLVLLVSLRVLRHPPAAE